MNDNFMILPDGYDIEDGGAGADSTGSGGSDGRDGGGDGGSD